MASTSAAAKTNPAPEAPPTVVQPHSQAPIEAESSNDYNEADSTLGSDVGSETTSIGSSILKYREENGRTYHAYKDGKNDRLDLQHHMWLLTLDGKLHLAPLGKKVDRVLDVGTGTGIWAIDFGIALPALPRITVLTSCQRMNIQNLKFWELILSPIQPSFIPPNLTFEIDDVEENWTYNKKFSYIHCRIMSGSFSDWPKFVAKAMEHLEPGGWLELQEFTPVRCDDGTLTEEDDFFRWGNLLTEAATTIGRRLDILWELKGILEAAGFEAVVQEEFIWPQNAWPKDPKLKELGMWCQENLDSGLEDLTMAMFTRVLGWSRQQVEVFLPGVRKSIKDKSKHGYMPIFCIYGQKPGGPAGTVE